MMVNGTVQAKTATGGGITATGDPTPTVWGWGLAIDCFIKQNNQNTKGKYEDGLFKVTTYEILIEDQDIEADRVLLTTDTGKNLGEFQVQGIERLSTAGRVKITV